MRRGAEMVQMAEEPYALEDDFQRLLADHQVDASLGRQVAGKWLS